MAELYLRYIDCSLPFIFHCLLCILAYFFWASLAFLIIPVFLIFQVIRWLEIAWISHHRMGTTLSLTDLPFAMESEENPNFINALIVLRGKSDVAGLRERVLERIIWRKGDQSYRRLRQYMKRKLNTFVWCDVQNFDISQHIPVYGGKPPVCKEELEECFATLCSTPLSRDIPPWQLTIIPLDFAHSDLFAIHFRIHHCMGDGFSIVGLMSQLVDEKPKFIQPRKDQGYMTNPVKRYLHGVCTGPLALLIIALSGYVKNPFASKKIPLKKTVAWTNSIPLETVKKLRYRTGTTVNDVLVSCLAGAIRRYLQETGNEDPEDHPITMTFNSRPLSHRLLECIPLSNNSGASFLSLPVSVSDPVKRLHLSKRRIDKMKQLADPHLFSFVFRYLIALFPLPFTKFTTFAIRKHCSLIFSNVPGPLEPLCIGGKEVESVMVTPPLVGNMGLVMAIFSYSGSVRLTVMSDQSVIREPSKLAKAFEEEVHILAHRISLQ